MLKLLKFLKPYALAVVGIFAILVVQAYCDLSLPNYTAKVVNVGIQQGGIDETVPKKITKTDLDKLLLFVKSGDKKTVTSAYVKTSDKTKKYGVVYKLKSSVANSDTKTDKLSKVIGKPMLIDSMIDANSKDVKKMTKEMQSQMKEAYDKQVKAAMEKAKKAAEEQAKLVAEGKAYPTGRVNTTVPTSNVSGTASAVGISASNPAGVKAPDFSKMTIYDMFKAMPEKERDTAIKKMDKKFAAIPDSLVTQGSTTYIKTAYKHAGMDTGAIQTKYLVITAVKMLALSALGMMAAILVGFLASKVAAGVGRGLRGKVFRKVVGFSNNEFDEFSTATLITRSTNDIQQIQLITVMILRLCLYAPIMACGGVWRVFNTNARMSWIIALAIGIILCIVIVLLLLVMPRFKIMQKLVDKLNLVSREILTGLPVIRAFNTEKVEEKRFDIANKNLTRVNLFVSRAMSTMMPLMFVTMNAITVFIVWTGAHGIDKGNMQVGDLMAFIQYTMQIIFSFLMISLLSIMLPRAAVAAGRVDEVLSSETIIHDPKNPKKFSENAKGDLRFNHVDFRYPGAEFNVLSDIDFEAKRGQTTAFIGSTGAGKSTLIRLIPRFYDVTDGSITIDGLDIRDVTQHDLRDKLGMVPQKGVLFSGTIKSNILFANEDASEEVMKNAASIAQATEFIDKKKAAYDSEIAQDGANVSGGQKQRLSIARAIAKNPEIYVFDDSFSALDYKTDLVLRTELNKVTKNSIVLIVAQRINTIMHADQIIVLDEGKIVGKGTHEELLRTCEEYYQIASSQLSEEEIEKSLAGKEPEKNYEEKVSDKTDEIIDELKDSEEGHEINPENSEDKEVR